jgi:serine/threonine protein phosphatase 1
MGVIKKPSWRQIAISDIHGCLKTFEALLDKVAFTQSDQLFLLGDFVDRGPDTKGVIDLVWKMQKEGYDVHCLRGNHEQMILDNLEAGVMSKYYCDQALLKSFDADDLTQIPAKYLKWMDELPYYLETEGCFLVHAGIDFTIDNPLDNTYDMMWLRYWYEYLDREWLGNRVIVHGHTPLGTESIEKRLKGLAAFPIMNVDNGCVFTSRDLGQLCAFDMTNRELFFQGNMDRAD